MIRHSSNQIYALAEDTAEYIRHKRLLSSKSFTVDAINKTLLTTAGKKVAKAQMVYVPLDESEIRKPESQKLEDLMRVRSLGGGLVNGYRTINTIAVSQDAKQIMLLETKPFTSQENQFLSENIYKHELIIETTTALRAKNPDLQIIYLLDRGFDDTQIMEAVTREHAQFILRVSHKDRLVTHDRKQLRLESLPFQPGGVKQYQKLTLKHRTYQDVTLKLSAASVTLKGHSMFVVKSILTNRKGEQIFNDPFYLLTNCSLSKPTVQAYEIFKAYTLRWKIEGVFKFLKGTLGWESFQVQDLKRIKHIIAMTYMVGAYLYEMGKGYVSEEFIECIARLGRGKGKIGHKYLMQGLQQIIGTIRTLEVFQTMDPHDIIRLYDELGYGERAAALFSEKKGRLI